MSLQSDQLPSGFIALLIEHCIDIAETMGSIPVKNSIFFLDFHFTTAFKAVCITESCQILFKLRLHAENQSRWRILL